MFLIIPMHHPEDFVVSMGGEAVDVISDGSGTTVPQLTRMGIGCNPTD